MSLDNHYPKRKDRRKPYYRSKRFDRTCRSGGSCPYCLGNRLRNSHRRMMTANQQIEDFLNESPTQHWPDLFV
jgi:hypothetical protein